MLRKLRPRSIYDVMAAIGCLAAVVGGTAYAANTVGSSDIIDETILSADIKNGEVKSVDIGNGEILSADVKDQSLTTFDVSTFLGADIVDGTVTGDDVDESSLGTVPSSVQGGLGRSQGTNSCDPESATFVNCNTSVTLTLSRPARVLVIGSATARLETPSTTDEAEGRCLLGTTSGAVPGTTVFANVSDVSGGVYRGGQVSMAGVTGVFPAGQHSFGVDCNEQISGVRFDDVMVTAIALSDQ
jgi:hypothetical protein